MRAFPKGQALPTRKHLPRIISQISVVDQLVERFFFQGYTDKELDFYPMLPTKKGIGFNEEHAHAIGESVRLIAEALGVDPVVSDVSGWERQLTQILTTLVARHIYMTADEVTKDTATVTLMRALRWWSGSLMTAPYVLDTGEIIDFKQARVQQSGDFLTTTCNGIARGICAVYVGSKPTNNGDDTVEFPLLKGINLKEAYNSIGLPVRDVETQSGESFTFCSHHFQRQVGGSWICWLSCWERMAYESSYSVNCDKADLANYLSEIRMMPDSCPDKARLIEWFNWRHAVLRAASGHDQEEECEQHQEEGSPESTSPVHWADEEGWPLKLA